MAIENERGGVEADIGTTQVEWTIGGGGAVTIVAINRGDTNNLLVRVPTVTGDYFVPIQPGELEAFTDPDGKITSVFYKSAAGTTDGDFRVTAGRVTNTAYAS